MTGTCNYNEIIVREFDPKDLASVLALDRDVLSYYDPEIFLTLYEYYPQTLLVAVIGNRIVGVAVGFKHTPLEGRIFWLAVSPMYQNHGLGRRLMTMLLKRFKRLGAITATLEVRTSNRAAQALYISMGFELVGIVPGYYEDGEAAMIMRRHI